MFRPAIALLILAVVPATAQWLDYKTPGIPRLRDGKPNLSAPAPRTADGKPDLSGIYQANNGTQFQNLSANLRAVPGQTATTSSSCSK